MTRSWTAWVADFFDVVPLPLAVLGSVVLAGLVAVGWYYWPQWLRRILAIRWGRRTPAGAREARARWGRLRPGGLRWRLRWRRRRRRRGEVTVEPLELAGDELPDLPAGVLALTADQLAAAGRFKEAVRERLRATVRDLIERGVLPPTPGWTVLELATAAGQAQPSLAPPLRAAVDVFSEIWYGLRPAGRADDDAMRGHAEAIRRLASATGSTLPAQPAEPAAAGPPRRGGAG